MWGWVGEGEEGAHVRQTETGRSRRAWTPLQRHSPPHTRVAVSGMHLEGKGPQRRLQRWLDKRLEEVAEAVGGGCCRLQMPLSLALGVRGTMAGHRLGALERWGGGVPPPLPMHPWAVWSGAVR